MKRGRTVAVAFAAALALPASADSGSVPLPELDRPDLEAWLDGYMPFALQTGDIAGAVVVVIKDGAVLLEKGYGYSDVAQRIAVDPRRTLFRPGSIAKTFTWTAVMQLVEQGKLDLDRDINGYLDFEIPVYAGKPITLRNLMTHTAGFEEFAKGVMSVDAVEPLGDFLKAHAPARIYPPGQTPAYSNYGAALAGYIVQRVAGESFDDYVDRHIFTPLGMSHSSFRQPLPAKLQSLMSQGYELASGAAKPYEMVGPAPAGALASTGDDMARFMIAHLQEGRYGDAQILKPATARLMHGTPLTILPTVNRMLLGFYETQRNGHRVFAHAGDTQWFHSALHLFADDAVGLFVSVNSVGREDRGRAIRNSLFDLFADRYFPGPAPEGNVEPALAQQHARLIAGRYDNSRRQASNFFALLTLLDQMKVVANADGTITTSSFRALNGQPKRWREISPLVWRQADGSERLGAKVEHGEIVMFSADAVSPFMVFRPTPAWRSSAWLLPALIASVLVLMVSALSWPVAAIARRHFAAPFALAGRAAQYYRSIRIASSAVILTLLAWVVTFSVLFSDISRLSPRADGWVWFMHILSFIVFAGAVPIALLNVRFAWSRASSGAAKLCSVLIAASCLVVLWSAVVARLIAFSSKY